MSRPPLRSTRDPGLGTLQDAIEAPSRVNPATAPELRAHSVATRAELRKTRGSPDGNRGPRALMLAGYVDPRDGGEGVFIWDNTSTTADDEGVTAIQVAGVDVGRWERAQLYPTPFGQLLRAPQVLTSGTTFAPLIPGKPALVEVLGAGGGGGGTNTAGASASVASGGSAGSYARKYFASLPASCAIAIGAAGTAGTAGNTGGTGGNTTFSDGTTTVTAPGGGGGLPQAAAATFDFRGFTGTTAVATNGDINSGGMTGDGSIRLDGVTGRSGSGGSSQYGAGGAGKTFGGAGNAAIGRGAGGGGGATLNGGAAVAGGAGTAGLIVVWEFN